MSKVISVKDPTSGTDLNLGVKAFLRGSLAGDSPTVTFVVSSESGVVLGHFDAEPEAAHTLSEYIRQEAELASIAKEEINQA